MVIAVIIVVWQVAVTTAPGATLFVPSPLAVGGAVRDALVTGSLWRDATATVTRATLAFGIAFVAGVPFGFLLGRQPRMGRALQPPLDFARSVPSSALFLLFLLFFGVGEQSKVAAGVYACLFPLMLNTMYGARQAFAEREREGMLALLGASAWQRFWYLDWPVALPHIIAGSRVSMSLAVVVVIVTEMLLGSATGLGARVYDSYLSFTVAPLYAYLLTAGAVGFVLNRAIVRAEAFLLPWDDHHVMAF